MNIKQINRLALRLNRSAWLRLEWRMLAAALFIAMTLASLLTVTGSRLEQSLSQQSAALLGADLVVSSSRQIDPSYADLAKSHGAESTTVTQLTSMLANDEQFLLSSVKAVNTPYPLRGEIKVSSDSKALPSDGEIWAEARVLERLGLTLGQSLQVGYQSFKLTGVIESSPDRGNGFGSFNPMILMNQSDLEATKLVVPGARLQYRMLFAGEADVMQQLESELKGKLTASERLISLRQDNNLQGGLQKNLSQYLKLSGVIALLICALSMLLSLRRYSEAQRNSAAILLNMGLNPKQLVGLYSLQLGWLWLICALLSGLAAWGASQLMDWLLSDLLPVALATTSTYLYMQGAWVGFGLLFTLGLAPIMSMSRVSIQTLLKQSKVTSSRGAKSLNIIAAVLLILAMSWYLGSIQQTLLLAALLLGGAFVIGLLGQQCIHLLGRLFAGRFKLGRMLKLRLAQQRRWHRIQIPVISLLLSLMALLWLARTDLMNTWQAQLPLDTPNNFLINIQPYQQQQLSVFFKEQNVEAQLLPIVRGRVAGKNGVDVESAFTTEQKKAGSLNRELNLTWGTTLNRSSELLIGDWPPTVTDDGLIGISVESGFAERLELGLGDRLSFNIGGEAVEGTVTSIRGVKWDTFEPNFYVIFPQQALENLSLSYITAFYLSPERRAVLSTLIEQFPALTLIEVDQLLQQARQVIQHLVDASALIMSLTLAAGGVLMVTLLNQELAQRRYESALLQAMGASRKQSRDLTRLEFGLLGGCCGLVAALIAEAALWFIYRDLLAVEPVLHPSIWILLPVMGWGIFNLLSRIPQKGRSDQILQQLRAS